MFSHKNGTQLYEQSPSLNILNISETGFTENCSDHQLNNFINLIRDFPNRLLLGKYHRESNQLNQHQRSPESNDKRVFSHLSFHQKHTNWNQVKCTEKLVSQKTQNKLIPLLKSVDNDKS